MSLAPPEVDPKEWMKWDTASKDKFLRALENAEKEKKIWYCLRGRSCDGAPHEGVDYGHARSDQWPPHPDIDWDVWLLKGGRGSGKTRSGAEWTKACSTGIPRGSIIGPTWPHVRDVMIEGESGLLAVFENAKIEAVWEPTKRKITVPCMCKKEKPCRGGVHVIQAFTGEEPERLRGPQHGYVWLDEPAHFKLIGAVWDNMLMGLRLGKRPRVLCSTTPLPTKWMKELIAEETTISVTASTYANLANLAPTFRKTVLQKYEGTRLGRQELHGEVLEDIVGALWTSAMIEENRVNRDMDSEENWLRFEDMDRIVVAIDPAGTSSKKRDETGIIVVGKRGQDYYVWADVSGHYTPDGWASAAWKAFDTYAADKVIAEQNYGGEMVLSTLKHSRADGPASLVHSRRGKVLRAEPVVALYEQGRVHHVGQLVELETQMTEWVPDMSDSPDRVDALVHGITALTAGGGGGASVAIPKKPLSGNSGAARSMFGR